MTLLSAFPQTADDLDWFSSQRDQQVSIGQRGNPPINVFAPMQSLLCAPSPARPILRTLTGWKEETTEEEWGAQLLLRRLREKGNAQPEEPSYLLGVLPQPRSMATMITPAAKAYAKTHGLYGALVLTQTRVWDMIPTMQALTIDLQHDPEEEGYSTLCFSIVVRASVEQVVEDDHALQEALIKHLTPRALMAFSFVYRFA